MKYLQSLAVVSLLALPTLSGLPITPQATVDYNPLLAADTSVKLNTAPKFVRLDRGAQLSAVYTSLLPEALRYSILDPAASASIPESPVVDSSTTTQTAPDEELLDKPGRVLDFVSFIGRSLPRQEFLVEVSRELLGIRQDSTFDVEQVVVSAATLLASALGRG